MRIVNIDLSRLERSYFIGFTNEHQITELHFKLSNDLTAASGFSLMFSVFGTKRIVNGLEAENGVISYVLPRDITGIVKRKCQVLMQITAYNEGTAVGKSPVINGWLDEGLEAEEEVDPTIVPLVEEIQQNTANRHNHANKATIDLFGIGDNDELLWNDEPIQCEVDLSEYARKDEVIELGDNISLLNNNVGYITSASLPTVPTKTSQLTNDSGFLTEHQSLAGYAKLSDLPTVPATLSSFVNDCGFLTQHQSLAAYALKSELPTVPTKVSAFANDAGYLTEHQSLAAYALKSELPTVPTKLSQFTNDCGFLTEHQSLAAYALKSELPVVPTNISAFTNDSGYLTQHQSLAAYALKSELPTVPTNISAFTNDAGYLTQHQSLAAYATKAELATVATSGSYNDLSNKPTIPVLPTLATVATSGSYNDLTNKPTIPTVPMNISSFTNDAGYLTQHQSLANYPTKSDIDEIVVGFEDFLYNEYAAPAYHIYMEVNQDFQTAYTNQNVYDIFESFRSGDNAARIIYNDVELHFNKTSWYDVTTQDQEDAFQTYQYLFVGMDRDLAFQYGILLFNDEEWNLIDEQEIDYLQQYEVELTSKETTEGQVLHLIIEPWAYKVNEANTATKWGGYMVETATATSSIPSGYTECTVYINSTTKRIRFKKKASGGVVS